MFTLSDQCYQDQPIDFIASKGQNGVHSIDKLQPDWQSDFI